MQTTDNMLQMLILSQLNNVFSALKSVIRQFNSHKPTQMKMSQSMR